MEYYFSYDRNSGAHWYLLQAAYGERQSAVAPSFAHFLQKVKALFARESLAVVKDQLSLERLTGLGNLTERLAESVAKIRGHDLAIEYRAVPEQAVPDVVSGDTVSKPLCQRY